MSLHAANVRAMARLGIKEAFERYGATLHNVQWSVSAWTPSDELVVSIWQHHYRQGPDGSMEFADSLARWGGPGNTEFRRNLERAHREDKPLRLVIVSTAYPDRIQAGEDASKVPKQFDPREDVVGRVARLEGDRYVLRFHRIAGAAR